MAGLILTIQVDKSKTEAQLDDEFIYAEIIKEINGRKIPFINILREEASKVFKNWNDKEDKIKY